MWAITPSSGSPIALPLKPTQTILPEVVGAEPSHGRFPPHVGLTGRLHQATLRFPVVPHRTAGPLGRAHGLALEPGPMEVQPEQAPEDEDGDQVRSSDASRRGLQLRAAADWGTVEAAGAIGLM